MTLIYFQLHCIIKGEKVRVAWLLLQRVQNKTWHDLACFCSCWIKCRLAAHRATLLFSAYCQVTKQGYLWDFTCCSSKHPLYYSMAHVANKGADCVQNNTAPEPIFKQDCFHILKILLGKRTFLPNVKLLFN